jgi:hypothetical protein
MTLYQEGDKAAEEGFKYLKKVMMANITVVKSTVKRNNTRTTFHSYVRRRGYTMFLDFPPLLILCMVNRYEESNCRE